MTILKQWIGLSVVFATGVYSVITGEMMLFILIAIVAMSWDIAMGNI